MLLHIPEVLSKEDVREMRRLLDAADWTDGRATVGEQGAKVKQNRQMPADHPVAKQIAEHIQQVLKRHPLFISAALPLRTLEPLFNRYEGGEHYGFHVDGAIMRQQGSSQPLRSDVSTTLFLCEPEEYEGGELEVVDTYGTHEVKLPAGDMIVYASTSLHRVMPVTRGVRVCAFFWTQSMIRQDWQRHMMFELDQTIQRLRATLGDNAETTTLTGHYHNLLRLWADT
ncbi:PKHD-type hydroxylase [Roseateles sp. YR242]|uniref:Fe2+-dependent dioxygenase n=1 Tax=Roseateles sp. YR242 TaxID=1855305 RepID=UPI0008B52AC5|nr:Fe2+-dependent dioxygenase [Roseateles sp. YR242]SEL28432.1 PKHD-type hydroxylase [Roseateles sp. YR242]